MVTSRRITSASCAIAACASFTGSAFGGGGDGPDTATPIAELPFADTGDTTTLTDQFDVLCPFTFSVAPDAWYTITPTEDIALVIDLCASAFDTRTYVLDADFNQIACNDDACASPDGGDFRSRLDPVVVLGGTLAYVVVDGTLGDAGVYDLMITGSDPPGQCAIADACIGIDEGEPCDTMSADTVNGGCNSSPEVFSQVSCGDTVCANAWAAGGLRDTDWYDLQGIDGPTLVTCTVTSEFDARIFLPCADCAATCLFGVADIERCGTGSIAYVQDGTPANEVWWVIAKIDFDDLPCGGTPLSGNDYIATWTCGPEPCPIVGDLDASGAVDFADILVVLANWGACP